MVKVYIKNINRVVIGEKGDNLLKLLQIHNVQIQSSCGGNGTCGKCKVFDCDNNCYILSCQTKVLQDMCIVIDKIDNEDISFLKASNLNSIENDSENGFAVISDIGTTTLAMYLVNLNDGKIIDQYSCLNPQAIYGADVLSRIAQTQKTSTKALQKCLIDVMNKIIIDFKEKNKITKIHKFYASGNTTMLHIFLNINPKTIGYYPYTPVFLDQKEISGKKIGLNADNVVILPSISSFVGADITMGVLASEMLKYNNSLLIDLGTNGEMVLKKGLEMFATSTAAGPAFEGANIECGSGGISGAISKIEYEADKLNIKYIGDTPKSLTGSAIIDFISILLDHNEILKSGALNLTNAKFRFENDKIFVYENIYLSQKDVRQVQLAKSAIRSGMDTLLQINDIDYNDLDKVFIAGGFGFYINTNNAVKIKLIPKQLVDKIEVIGNSSASGALICALSKKQNKLASEISKRINVIDLNTNTIFNDLFIKNIDF